MLHKTLAIFLPEKLVEKLLFRTKLIMIPIYFFLLSDIISIIFKSNKIFLMLKLIISSVFYYIIKKYKKSNKYIKCVLIIKIIKIS